jgi:hypothetical protein
MTGFIKYLIRNHANNNRKITTTTSKEASRAAASLTNKQNK